jgi:hypothetical protein
MKPLASLNAAALPRENVIAAGGVGVVTALQSGHRLGALTAEADAAFAVTPGDEVLALPMLQPDQVTDASHNNHRVRSVDVGGSGSTPVP